MNTETITINKNKLEELIAKEVAKKITSQANNSIFKDLAIIDKRVAEINREYPEIVQYVQEQSKRPPAYHKSLTELVHERSRWGDGFMFTKPSLYADPETLIRKLVCLMFGAKNVRELDGRDVEIARSMYYEISNIFINTYKGHLENVIEDRRVEQ
ncbi:TPA: hypothetical protein ACU0L5_000430 [Streptococcus suis]